MTAASSHLGLAQALTVGPGDIVSFVGAGGKTTTMYALAAELAQRRLRVLITTTTRMYPPGECGDCSEADRTPPVILEEDPQRLLERARQALRGRRVVVAAGRLDNEGKLSGLPPHAIVRRWLNAVDVILVEADGAAGRPFKAPGELEPVIPRETTVVVPVVGCNSLGRPLNGVWVHRPSVVARLTGAEEGELVTPKIVASVFLHPRGYLKSLPDGARWIPFINKVETLPRLAQGRELARLLLRGRTERVVLGAVGTAGWTSASCATESLHPVRQVMAPVRAVILAAGVGERMAGTGGSSKLLLEYNGRTLLEHAVGAALGAGLEQTVVVLGHQAAEGRELLTRAWPGRADLLLVDNPDYAAGQAGSVRVGLRAAGPGAHAVVFCLADQPLVTADTVAALTAAYLSAPPARPPAVVAPVHGGRRGNPVLIDRRLFSEVMAVTGDKGPREVLARHTGDMILVPSGPEVLLDIDTVGDYRTLVGRARADPGASGESWSEEESRAGTRSESDEGASPGT